MTSSTCKKNIDETEDAITLATLAEEIKTMKQEVSDQEVHLKKASIVES